MKVAGRAAQKGAHLWMILSLCMPARTDSRGAMICIASVLMSVDLSMLVDQAMNLFASSGYSCV